MTTINDFLPHKFNAAEYVRGRFALSLQKEFCKEDLLDNKKWRNVAMAHNIRAGDIIEVTREDFAFYAELLVIGRQKDELFLKFINFANLEEEKTEKIGEDFEVKWKGPAKKWTIIRKSDNKEIKDAFSSKEEAAYFLKNNY